MYHDKPRATLRAKLIPALAVLVIAVCLLRTGFTLTERIRADSDAQAAQTLRQSVLNAAVQCYAVEGAYPANLKTLEEEYGVRINRNKFIVRYSAYASNLLPEVVVLQKS